MGGDYRHEVVLMRQLGWKGADHFGISAAQRHRRPLHLALRHRGAEGSAGCRRLASGELVGAIAMTEPGAGSDLQGIKTTAIKSGNGYVVNGSKTFITNGQLANFIIVVGQDRPGRRAPRARRLIVVETDGAEGFERGRNLAQDRHGGQRHLRAVLQRREGPGRQHHRRRRGPGLRPADAAAAAGAAEHRRPGRRRRRARRSPRPWPTSRSARPSARRSSTSRTPSSNWPRCKTKLTVAKVFSTTASACT